ncbi:D-ribitol-5-phosphate cytidylyltransferase [Nymphon striatum]|nr:D-ribitol-5-phosphate cytidylyltransferase [Nymphon striatum]
MAQDILKSKISVIIPAAGNGERAGGIVPKQLFKIMDKPILEHTIEMFCRISTIEEIIIVQRSDHNDVISKIVENLSKKYDKSIFAVNGSSTRHRSISIGLKALSKSADVVIIHDSVRPLINEAIVLEIASWALKDGACGIVRPLVSTVVSSNSKGYLKSSLNRLEYHASEMPQGFKMNLIKSAYDKCDEHDYEFGTECLHLVHKYCAVSPKLIETEFDLWKVTHPRDLFSVDRLIKERDILVEMQPTLIEFPDLISELRANLQKVHIQLCIQEKKFHGSGSAEFWGTVIHFAFMTIVRCKLLMQAFELLFFQFLDFTACRHAKMSNCYIAIFNENFKFDLNRWLDNSKTGWGSIIVIIPSTINISFEKALDKTKEFAEIEFLLSSGANLLPV